MPLSATQKSVARYVKKTSGRQPPNWLVRRPASYWAATRRPFPSLLLVAPLLVAYEAGVLYLGRGATAALRTGADTWMRNGLTSLGLTDHWLLPLVLCLILMGWQLLKFQDWRFSPAILVGMIIESGIWAVALVGVSRAIDLAFAYLERGGPLLLAANTGEIDRSLYSLVGFIGAGVYEETLFRLILVPVFFHGLRVLQTPTILASSLAVTGSALLFALAHHAGTPGETFTWFAFVFRWMAGVFFAWVFVLRGFGIAVGTHTIYDILVGWIIWRA